MELRHLRYFVGVARELSFTRAAARLRIAQPALSRQVRQLEDELGVRLFERKARGVRLTPAGEAFLVEAQALLRQSETLVRTAQTQMSGRCSRLEVGYVWGLFHTLAPRWIARFRQEHPEVAVNLFDQTATEQARALRDGQLDLGFIGLAYEADAARLAKQKVGDCAFVAALPVNHPAARSRRIALGELAEDSFILISEQNYPGAAEFLKSACRQAGFRPRILQTAERGYTILGLVAGGCGVTLLPESLRALPHPGVCFRPIEGAPRCDLFVAWNPVRLTPPADAFLKCLSLPEADSP